MRTRTVLQTTAVLAAGTLLGWLAASARLDPPPTVGQEKAEYPATGLRHSWNAGPAMKVVAEFEQSLKKFPPIPPSTPDPYTPSK